MSLIRRNEFGLPGWRPFFSDFFDRDSFFSDDFFRKDWLPAVNVKVNEGNYEVEFAVPGLNKEDFKVAVNNGVLTVSSQKQESKEEKKDNYTRKEFSYESFSRSFTLPQDCKEENISARYENGVLHLSIQKKAAVQKPASQEIKVN